MLLTKRKDLEKCQVKFRVSGCPTSRVSYPVVRYLILSYNWVVGRRLGYAVDRLSDKISYFRTAALSFGQEADPVLMAWHEIA